MPRPKRTKVAPSKPISFATIAAEKSKPSEPGRAISPASASVSSSRRTNTSDDSDGLVTANKAGVHQRGVAPLEVTMSGALAVEDMGDIGTRPMSSKRRVALSRIAREADHAKAIESLRAQKDTTSAAEKLANERKRIEVHLPSTQMSKPFMAKAGSSTHPLVNAVQDSQPTQSARMKATPSRETSILDIENFKRRPRQPSLLQIARAQIAAEGSSLDDTLEEFEPDDQSTPLHHSHTGPQRHLSSSSGRLSSSRKRKLSTPEIQVPASQSQGPQDISSPVASLPDDLFDIAANDSQPEDPPLPAIPVANLAVAPRAIDSDILAPPRSSSPTSPQKRTHQTNARTKNPQPARKPINKAPELKNRSKQRPSTALPLGSPSPRRPASPSTVRSPLKPLTTSALQNLLPRRRRVVSKNKENNVFELNTSSDLDAFDDGTMDEDADELSHHATAKPGARKAGAGKAKRTTGRKGKAAAVNGVGSKAKAGKRPGANTYARKRNMELDDDGDGNEDAGSSGGGEEEDEVAGAVARAGKAGEELRRKAAFFREEVDVWGLEFEEVTGSSDRMRDAR
ncbi:MAG: hypothetical protein LQ345_001521 [Seirophora villosa]|nr:MAG: hypothetical protein LQ345_001521 [Seirophora villosa]